MGRSKKKAAAADSKTPPRQPHYDIEQIRSYACGQWACILSHVGGISSDFLDGNHHKCPKPGCPSTRDAFRFADFDGDGAILCNQCARTGIKDGFHSLQWFTGKSFYECLSLVAAYLGVAPSDAPLHKQNGKTPADPAKNLKLMEWDEGFETLTAYWRLWKPPITLEAIKRCHGHPARYRDEFTVLAFPIWGDGLSTISGWTLYNITGGRLPAYSKDDSGNWSKEWEKILTTFGSKAGFIGPVSEIAAAETIWKLEGPSDLLAFYSMTDIPPRTVAVTNASGAGEKPHKWMLDLFAGRDAITLHDADEPGQRGAMGYIDDRGNPRIGWASAIASRSAACRNAVLPYAVEPSHGRDLRDFINEALAFESLAATPFDNLQVLADAAPLVGPAPDELLAKIEESDQGERGESGGRAEGEPPAKINPLEEDDDPHRLARVNLARYGIHRAGATLRFWRDEWYTWKDSRGAYRKIAERELRAKLTASIREEFERCWQEAMERYEEKRKSADYDAGSDTGPPTIRKVNKTLVSNVLDATASITCVPSSVELMTFLDDSGQREQRSYVAMRNGILDLEAALADADLSQCLLPHSPQWFSTICLPYAFDPEATCPKWEAFLEKNLEMDPERIKILQEWAGYLLLPDTGEQKFLVLEGEGANGKSVYCAAMTAMLGSDNCSHIPLELFADRFAKTQTLGKLVNISADVGELDKVAEGYLKSFTSGDVMFFDRKTIPGIDCTPSARLTLACNNRPRFSDRSSGIWRRMLLIPWRIEIKASERIRNMDKPKWWEKAGELPGIFNWALVGLSRLRNQAGFTDSELSTAALEDYRLESNPARAFLKEHLETCESQSSESPAGIKATFLYKLYSKWAESSGYRPMGERLFGKEVKRAFPVADRKRGGSRSDRFWFYANLKFSSEEICDTSTGDGSLF